MMNPAIVMTIEEYNVAYLVNELLNNGCSFPCSDLVRDMVNTMSEESLEEVVHIHSSIGLPEHGYEYAQEAASIVLDTIIEDALDRGPSDMVHRTSFVTHYVNASPVTPAQWRGEVKELLMADSLANLKEEWADVLYMSYCLIYNHLNIDLKMYGATPSTRKFIGRFSGWKQIFSNAGLRFHRWYLSSGSNYRNLAKVDAVLERAYREQKIFRKA